MLQLLLKSFHLINHHLRQYCAWPIIVSLIILIEVGIKLKEVLLRISSLLNQCFIHLNWLHVLLPNLSLLVCLLECFPQYIISIVYILILLKGFVQISSVQCSLPRFQHRLYLLITIYGIHTLGVFNCSPIWFDWMAGREKLSFRIWSFCVFMDSCESFLDVDLLVAELHGDGQYEFGFKSFLVAYIYSK